MRQKTTGEGKRLLLLCGLGLMVLVLATTPRTVAAASAKSKFYKAQKCYHKLAKSPRLQKYRDRWMACIEGYYQVYRYETSGPWAAAGLYHAGLMYQQLYKHSYLRADQQEAADLFKRIIKRFPKSAYRAKAENQLRQMGSSTTSGQGASKAPRRQSSPVSKDKIAAIIAKEARAPLRTNTTTAPNTGPAVVEGLRHWSNPNYTRVVIDADQAVGYTHRLLKKDPSLQKPQRLYVDLAQSRLSPKTRKIVEINDNLLMQARAGQYASDTVRVVVDIKSFKTYKIFSLRNPFRIVIDVWGSAGQNGKAQTGATTPIVPGSQITGGALAKQLALGVRRIVVDPGHGGRDFGAPGALKGVHEKNVVLAIANKLAVQIRKRLNCEVIMTRKDDRYLTLEERTAIANTQNADLFISIHTNASRNRRAFGIETYFLNLATDDESILVAARENATSTKNISDLQTILNDLMQNAKINESSRLAGFVQQALTAHMQKKYSRINGKGVKQAPFYVLLGAQMPAILVETSFISNTRECKRLVDPRYQDHLVDGIIKGIGRYITETNPTVLMGTNDGRSAGG